MNFAILLVILAAIFDRSSSAPRSIPHLDDRIVGGIGVRIEEYPYQVSIEFYRIHICGGSIISANWILTAGHCVESAQERNLRIRSGSSYVMRGGQTSRVQKIHKNPDYNSWTLDSDIALLELQTSLLFNKGVAAIALPTPDQKVLAGSQSIVTGWGRLSETAKYVDILQMVKVPIISNEDCSKAYGAGLITDRMICAGYLGVGGKDACQGDSGGPLVIDGDLIGVVSWGYGCARPKFPGVYTSVPSLRSYITKISGI